MAFGSIFNRSTRPRRTARDMARIEGYRRAWLYYSSPDGDPYRAQGADPGLSAFKGLPDYITAFLNYAPYIVDVDLHFLFADHDLTSVSASGKSARDRELREFGEAIGLDTVVRSAALTALVCGDAWVKVIPDPDSAAGVRMVHVDPAAVHPRLDAHDCATEREVVISYGYRDEEDRLRRWTELWTPDLREVWRDGEQVTEESGPNPLGLIPLVHFSCMPVPGSYFGRPAFAQIISDMDRMNTALGALLEVFRYYGSPKLILKGFMAPEMELDPDARQFWQIPSGDAEISFLEWRNTTGLMDEILKLDSIVRRKLPEFVLDRVSDRAYPTSGFAVSLQLSLLDAKIAAIASSFAPSVARLVEMALFVAGKSAEAVKVGSGNRPAGSWRDKADAVTRLLDSGLVKEDEARNALAVDALLD